MKKFGKFVFTTVSLAAVIGGAVYFVKNVLNKNSDDDFEDFDDDFDDFDLNEDETETSTEPSREYVTININETSSDETSEEAEEEL